MRNYDVHIAKLQKLICNENIDLNIKYIQVMIKYRCVCITFFEKGTLTGKPLTTSVSQVQGTNTMLAGETHADYTDEENAMCHKVAMIIGNYFWLWLTYYDSHILNDEKQYGKNVIDYILSGHEYRNQHHPEECSLYTFKEKIENYNNQVNDYLFGVKTTETINIDSYDWKNFQYIEHEHNMYS